MRSVKKIRANSGKIQANNQLLKVSRISIGWSAAAADDARIHLTEGSSHAIAANARQF